MRMSLIGYLSSNLTNVITIAFYIIVIALLVIYRKKFEFQGIVALRKTKIGIKFINRFSKKHLETIKILGLAGIGIGFVGMLFIFGYVIKGLYTLFFHPAAPATLSLVLPGVNVPGSPIMIPLWVLVPLFFVVLLHEAGHGIVAKAYKIAVKSTGVVFFGPLAGAFVEPDEKQLKKAPDHVQYAVYAAGPFMNALTAAVALLLIVAVINPITATMIVPTGFSFSGVENGYPAQLAGLEPGVVYTTINNMTINSSEALLAALSPVKPGDIVTIGNATSQIPVTTVERPDDAKKGFLGITGIVTEMDVKDGAPAWLFYTLRGIFQFLFWIFTLSLGLGAFNLLPLGPVDGGRMIQLAFKRMYGEIKGHKYWSRLGFGLLFIILILIVVPILRSAF